MRLPILTYQPMHIDGNGYRDNELVALASDLRRITQAGFRIVPLRSAIDAWLDNRGGELEGKVIALTSDNGADFDCRDLLHPTAGMQRSVINILRDFAAEHPGRQETLHVTAFAIASPEARRALDAACMIGKGWWGDDWWKAAVESGLMHIANHSWDHHHEALPKSFSQGVRRGTFTTINSAALADYEIRQAADYLREHAPNPGAALFAYPYGETNPYLTREYFPDRAEALGIRAAFTTRAGFFEAATRRWEIPRFVFGQDWTSGAELQSILDAAADGQRAWVPIRKQTLMTPPKAATTGAAQPRAKPTTTSVAFTRPPKRTSSGVVAARIDVDGPATHPGAPLELTLTADSIGLRFLRKIDLRDDAVGIRLAFNTHLFPNGKTSIEASLARDGRTVWSERFALDVSNVGPLADKVRASLRATAAPLVREGPIDSTDFDIANQALLPWFDRPDALTHIAALRSGGLIDAAEEGALAQFVKDGYLILPAPVEEELLGAINRELDDAIERRVEGYQYGTSQRIHNLHHTYPGVRALWRHPAVMRYLGLIFEVSPRACQTLTYVFGSQQGAHQDTIHLTPFPAGYMCGVWVALEDVQPNSGELEVYRGSHRLPRVYMAGSGCAKIEGNDWSQFDGTVAACWRDMLESAQFEKIVYRPKRGAVLIWHENLMHAGGVRLDQSLSRRSIVSHYFADGAIAFYDSTGTAGHME